MAERKLSERGDSNHTGGQEHVPCEAHPPLSKAGAVLK